jgi:hypothetical protein
MSLIAVNYLLRVLIGLFFDNIVCQTYYCSKKPIFCEDKDTAIDTVL